ncbi:BTB/POZ domain-containing protein At1g50280-like [Phalaenopsis equestris]|uniref:BTB/POZ domain-containing protein At1g50280-like n=1 Tax=Phalaenopsis equestris TaxID=78828 RepID=UPI0009E532AF|nr:BTB/POZ domain-containing protein At1g50280-like [Phalaenopsis equestris]
MGGHHDGVYDVKFVMRLVRFFVNEEGEEGDSLMKMKKVGSLMDKYLREISPDHRLKVSKFLGVAESLPDSARDCYDGVYRALEIFIQSHPNLSFKERKRLCRCLNYEKLTLETCKDLAKNPKIPPDVAVQALASQLPKLQAETKRMNFLNNDCSKPVLHPSEAKIDSSPPYCFEQKQILRFNFQQIQKRKTELENLCNEMSAHMPKIVKSNTH